MKILVAITYVLMILANVLANALPINGITTGEISDKYSNLFAPAGFTFSIWGLIYLLLAGYVLYQFGVFTKGLDPRRDEIIKKVNPLFIATSIINFFWIFSWHYDYIGISVVLMIALLVALIKIAKIVNRESLPKRDNFFIRIPFSVYFGWITVATIANITVLLVSLNWNGFGLSDQFWTVLILFVGTAIGLRTGLLFKNSAYLLVLVWAYFGILSKHVGISGINGAYTSVIYSAVACISLFIMALLKLNIKSVNKGQP